MEKINSDLGRLISNGKKSLNNPYTAETIAAKKEELREIKVEVENLLGSKGVTEAQKEGCIEGFNKLLKEYLDVLKQHEENRRRLELTNNLKL